MIIFAVTLVGSIPLGMLVALGRLSKFKPLSLLMQLFISVLRGTPLMLQIRCSLSPSCRITCLASRPMRTSP